MQLSPEERSRRFYSAAVGAARRSRVYEREAPVDELLGDLAVLRAIAEAAERRRGIYGGLMGVAVLVAVIAAGQLQHDPVAPFIVVLPVLFLLWLFRRFTRPWDVRRVDLVSGLLRRLDVAAAQLRIDLRSTERRRFVVAGGPGAKRYVNPWLSLDTRLAGGARVELARSEQCDYTHQSYGRRQVFTWAYGFEDAMTLHVPGPTPEPSLPERFTRRAFDVQADRVTLKVSSALRWAAAPEEGSVDAVELWVGWLKLLGAQPQRAQPQEPVTASCWAIGPRAIGWLLLLLSAPPAAGAVYSVLVVQERLAMGTPLMSIGQAGEAGFFAGVTVLLWVGVTLLGCLPRRRARRTPA